MSANLRPYKDLFPQTGHRVMIDATSVAIGDVEWPMMSASGRWSPFAEMLTMWQ
jgi:hypothetical protein